MSDYAPRPPESLTKLEKAWLRRRFCGWCDARTDKNYCHAMIGEYSPDPTAKRCTPEELDKRRGRWLAQDYKPRIKP